MAATNARSGFGTLFQRGDGASPTELFTTVAEVTSISGPRENLEFVDATHMESPNAYREKIATLLNSGQVTIGQQWLAGDTSQNNLRLDMRNRVKRNFRILPPGSGKKITFSGLVVDIGREFPLDNKMTADVTIEVTGPVEIADHP